MTEEVKVKRTRKPRTKVIDTPTVLPVDPYALPAHVEFYPTKESYSVGDKQAKAKEAPIVAMPLDVVEGADLINENHDVNRAHLSGKRAGAVLWNQSGVYLAVATGDLPNSTWIRSNNGSLIPPTGGTTSSTTSIGDGKRRQKRVPITALWVPVLTDEELSTAGHVINDSSISGKQQGAIVVDTTGHIFMAEGSLPTDSWHNLTDSTHSIVPTGVVGNQMNTFTGQKARSRQSHVSALPVPVVEVEYIGKANHPVNDNRVSGKRSGAMLATEDNDLVIAVGTGPTDAWYRISNGQQIVPL